MIVRCCPAARRQHSFNKIAYTGAWLQRKNRAKRIGNRMSNEVAHKSGWQTFEVVFGVPFLAALVLQRIIPLSFPRGSFIPALAFVGAVLVIVGITLVVLARREFARYGQPTDPGRPTHAIVTSGVFSISRNPLYLGGIFFLAGISLAFNLLWALILLLPSIIACHFILIAPEERYLSTRFGKEYDVYMATVSRWLGRKRKLD